MSEHEDADGTAHPRPTSWAALRPPSGLSLEIKKSWTHAAVTHRAERRALGMHTVYVVRAPGEDGPDETRRCESREEADEAAMRLCVENGYATIYRGSSNGGWLRQLIKLSRNGLTITCGPGSLRIQRGHGFRGEE